MNDHSARPAPPKDPALLSPLAPFEGTPPPAPAWFTRAVDHPHERHHAFVEDATIEWLAWGERGRPGLLLVHGGGAHADWWRFIAPLLADHFRVAAPSLSGMGGSSHRPHYSVAQHARELLAVADAAGLGTCFTVAGHSYGGLPTAMLAIRNPERICQTIILDSPFTDRFRINEVERPPHRTQPTLKDALARFRWAPPQPTLNPFIADFIARSSLAPHDNGWRWKFDSNLWPRFDFSIPRPQLADVPGQVDFIGGQYSALAPLFGDIPAQLPEAGRFVELPEAYHHLMADQPLALVATLRALVA